jgi:hypothetical protein
MAVCCGNCRKQISADFVAIGCLMLKCWHIKFNNRCALSSYVRQAVLYRRLCECGECGCNYECQCDCCCNMKHADMKLRSLFEACQLSNAVTHGSMLCHTVTCKYSCEQF